MISSVEALKKALKHSEDILTLAEKNDWEQVETGLNKRDQQLHQVINQATPVEEASAVRDLVAEIQVVSAKITVLVETQRDVASAEINKQHKGKKMQNAYNKAKRSY